MPGEALGQGDPAAHADGVEERGFKGKTGDVRAREPRFDRRHRGSDGVPGRQNVVEGREVGERVAEDRREGRSDVAVVRRQRRGLADPEVLAFVADADPDELPPRRVADERRAPADEHPYPPPSPRTRPALKSTPKSSSSIAVRARTRLSGRPS